MISTFPFLSKTGTGEGSQKLGEIHSWWYLGPNSRSPREEWAGHLHAWPRPEDPAPEHINRWVVAFAQFQAQQFASGLKHGDPQAPASATGVASVPLASVFSGQLYKSHCQMQAHLFGHQQTTLIYRRLPMGLWEQQTLHGWVEAVLSAVLCSLKGDQARTAGHGPPALLSMTPRACVFDQAGRWTAEEGRMRTWEWVDGGGCFLPVPSMNLSHESQDAPTLRLSESQQEHGRSKFSHLNKLDLNCLSLGGGGIFILLRSSNNCTSVCSLFPSTC